MNAPPTSPLPATPLAALQSASQALARAQTDEAGVLTYLQEQIRCLLPPSRIHLLLFFAAETDLFAWDREGNALPPEYFDTPAAQGIMGWLRQTKESLLVGDFRRDWEHLPAKPSYEHPHPPRSAIFVPLVVGDEALGALSAQSDEPDVYSPDHLWQLKILANQAAAALRASRLLASERGRAHQLQTLAEVTRSLVSILDLDALLSRVVDVIQAAFDYYHVQVFVVEKGSDKASFRASSGKETHDLWRKVGRSVKIGREGIIGWVAAHGEPLLAPDVSIDPLYIPDDPRLLPDTCSEVAVPLKVEDEVLGVLDVQSNRSHGFDRDDVFILTALADAVALAVVNARLYAWVQEDAWITAALLEVAEATGRLTELGDVLDTIVRITPLLTGAQSCAVVLRDAADGAYRPMSQWGAHEETAPLFLKLAMTANRNPVISLLETEQRPVVARPAQLDDMVQPIAAQALLADAVVFLPLMAKGEMIGFLTIGIAEHESPLTEARLPLLKGIADQAAAAVENSQLIAAQREEAWVNTALLQVAEAMARARDLPETLSIVARLTTTFSGFDRCTILLRQGQTDAFAASISYTRRREMNRQELHLALESGAWPLFAEVLRRRSPIVTLDACRSQWIPTAIATDLNLRTLAALPLVANDVVVGVMVVDDADERRMQGPRLLDILGGIANQAAMAIERARLQATEVERERIAAELTLARSIQEGFLPSEIPPLSGYEIAALWEPARQISGDFYDFIPLGDGRLGIVVGDVADKGIPAALFMALCRTAMRLVASSDSSPAIALHHVNTAILDNSYSDLFVTVYYAVVDPATHRVSYASGGHGLALRARAGAIDFLRGRGTVLGILPTIRIEEYAIDLAAGEYLIIYTDGVTDALNNAGEEFSENRLTQTIRRNDGLDAAAMLAAIREEVRVWEAGAPPFDDFTLVVLRRLDNLSK